MKKELKPGTLAADKSAYYRPIRRPTFVGVNEIAVSDSKTFRVALEGVSIRRVWVENIAVCLGVSIFPGSQRKKLLILTRRHSNMKLMRILS